MNARNISPSDSGLMPAERIANQQAYRVSTATLRPRLRLDRNEGRPPTIGANELAKLDLELLRRYPSVSNLEASLADRLGVDREQVLVTAGGDDALLRICLALLEPGREMILPVPTFEMLTKYCCLADGKCIEVPWPQGEYPVQAVLERVTDQTSIIAVVSPNNPTGQVISSADFSRLSAEAPRALLLVDLAYTEFADVDLTIAALRMPNAIVVRTFSKAWGLAGLRVGYAAGPARLIEWLRRAGNPYAVSGLSTACATLALLDESNEIARYVAQVRAERATLFEYLFQKGLDAVPSQGNFVFARTTRAESIWKNLAEQGIAVRWFGEQPSLSDGLRITCPGNQRDFDILISSLGKIL